MFVAASLTSSITVLGRFGMTSGGNGWDLEGEGVADVEAVDFLGDSEEASCAIC